MTTSPPIVAAPHRFKALDSLRGICACVVVLHHMPTQGFSSAPFFRHGFMFVDFFFVLSGFVIAASYGGKLELGFSTLRFMGLRLGRIWPLHAFMLLLFLAFEIAFAMGALGSSNRYPFRQGFELYLFVACVFLVQPFVGPDGTPWNRPSWSIAVEVWTYLIFALLFRSLGRLLVPTILLIIVAATAYLAQNDPNFISVVHDGALPRCLLGFALGVLAQRSHAWVRGLSIGSGLATLLEIMTVAAIVTFVSRIGNEPASVAAPFFFFLAVMLFALERGSVSRVLQMRFPRHLGRLSYSIYMVHMFIVYRAINVLGMLGKLTHGRWMLTQTVEGANEIGGGPLFGNFAVLLLLGVVMLFAHFTYRWIEKPAQDWSRRTALGDHPPRPTAVAEAEAPTF